MKTYICPDCGAIENLPDYIIKAPNCPMFTHKCKGQHKMVKTLLEELRMSNKGIPLKTIRSLHKRLNK
jgi:hypothetical protein